MKLENAILPTLGFSTNIMGVEALEGEDRGCILGSLDMEIGNTSLGGGKGARRAHDRKALISKVSLLWHFDGARPVYGVGE